jgi:hypothetical protein
MSQSIIIIGDLPTPEQVAQIQAKRELTNYIVDWRPTMKLPKHNTLVHTYQRPPGFKARDPRIMSIGQALGVEP